MSTTAPWRPPQWQEPSVDTIMITFPGAPQSAPYDSTMGGGAALPNEQTQYVFDAVILANHEQRLNPTQHPVQTGASISDHAFVIPARLTLEIGMSDAMDAYFDPDTWSGSDSKSVSAYMTLLAIQLSRIPISVTTKLRIYDSMIIAGLTPQESFKTKTGLRARVEFQQIFMAETSQPQDSSRPQDTSSTDLGSQSTQPPTAAQQSQNGMDGLSGLDIYPSDALGAGMWSSVNVNNLLGLSGK